MKRKSIILGLGFLLSGLIIIAASAQTPSTFEGFRMEDAIINVANTTGKAVVSISTEHTAKIGGGRDTILVILLVVRPEKTNPFADSLMTSLARCLKGNTNR